MPGVQGLGPFGVRGLYAGRIASYHLDYRHFVGLLLPALGQAKLKARRIVCLSNIKQLALASFAYAGGKEKHAGYDSTFLRGGWMGTLLTQPQEKQLCICPSAPIPLPTPPSGSELGAADRAWVRWTADNRTRLASSYGYNGWLYSDLLEKTAGAEDPAYPALMDKLKNTMKAEYLFTRENSIQTPAQTPVFVDANWLDLWPLEKDLPSRDLYAGLPFGKYQDYMGRCTLSRHGTANPSRAPRRIPATLRPPGAINAGLADGHAELVNLDHLWNYTWHRDWQAPAILPWARP